MNKKLGELEIRFCLKSKKIILFIQAKNPLDRVNLYSNK